jgi:hypothetical protein
MAAIAMSWMIENVAGQDGYPSWGHITIDLSDTFIVSSLFALLVMNFDRYLATHHPVFHRTSVTKRKLLTLLGILVVLEVTLRVMSQNDFVISIWVHGVIFLAIVVPPMLFINYKLFRIARKNRRNNEISPEMKKSFSLKNVSSCLLATACFLMFSIPGIVYIGLDIASNKTPTLSDYANLAGLWTRTLAAMNSTCNCLIFYWKNRILRIEGMKLVKRMKICRRFRSQSDH